MSDRMDGFVHSTNVRARYGEVEGASEERSTERTISG